MTAPVPLIICARCHEPAGPKAPPCRCARARAQEPRLSRLARVGLDAAALADARGSDSITPEDITRAARRADS